MNNVQPILYKEFNECSGCSACVSICPQKAIKMDYNSEGFLYPIIDSQKCIGCLKCERVCAFKIDRSEAIIKDDKIHIYACRTLDDDVLMSSSSGGMFSVFSDYYLENNNVVVSCIYSYEEASVRFCFLKDKNMRDLARGSKYIQAEIYSFYDEIVDYLNKYNDARMLVVGTGCQIAGLDLVLKNKKLRERVTLIDLICHGAASSRLWKNYIRNVEQKNDGKVNYLTFKNKRNGWENPSVFALINEKEITIKPYSDWFYMGISLRESCYNCPYTRIDRNSDITIGDFWGVQNVMPDFYDKRGISLVITHSECGEDLFNNIKDKIVYRETNRESCLQPRLISPQDRPKNRDKFWHDMERQGLDYCEKKYVNNNNSTIARIRRKVSRVFFKCFKQIDRQQN